MKYRDVVQTEDGKIGIILFGQNEQVIIQLENNEKIWVYEDKISPSDEPLYLEVKEEECVCPTCGGSGKDTETVHYVKRK